MRRNQRGADATTPPGSESTHLFGVAAAAAAVGEALLGGAPHASQSIEGRQVDRPHDGADGVQPGVQWRRSPPS